MARTCSVDLCTNHQAVACDSETTAYHWSSDLTSSQEVGRASIHRDLQKSWTKICIFEKKKNPHRNFKNYDWYCFACDSMCWGQPVSQVLQGNSSGLLCHGHFWLALSQCSGTILENWVILVVSTGKLPSLVVPLLTHLWLQGPSKTTKIKAFCKWQRAP